LVFETPESCATESKRRKISPCNITHISQTPEPEFKTPSVPKKDITRNEKPSISKTDITHVSQSENCHESQGIGLKRKASSPENYISHVSQSQDSHHEEKPKSSLTGRLGHSNVDVTHISQSQPSQHEEIPPEVKTDGKYSHEITHISQSQNSQAQKMRKKDEEKASEKQELDEINTDEEEQERISRIQDLSSIKSILVSPPGLSSIKSILVSPPGSGWMSKRSFSMKKEKSEMNGSGIRTDIEGGIEELEGSNSGNCSQGGNTVGESQGLSSKQEQHTVWRPL
jgi:hypothetical protein